ncbi:hypothetical protein BJ170DRAFT_326142 [Xylariales sp. AK1849]|nr:hypothetical protein BJ170DRAFT_326142 [Xylariales sp. AK1849]
MIRAQVGRKVPLRISSFRSPIRKFGTQQEASEKLPRVRVAGPVLWCFAVAGTIYLGCAAYEVRRDVKTFQSRGSPWTAKRSPETYDELDSVNLGDRIRSQTQFQDHPRHAADVSSLPSMWHHLPEVDKVIVGAIGLNTSLFAACRLVPALYPHLWHVPVGPSNYTLLTSMFGHQGFFHLGLNMYALYNFGPPVARSRTFEGSGSHLTAFYLASGVMASLAHHLETVWPSPQKRFHPGLGASGGIMAVIGAFALSYPNSGIGIVLIPGSIPAQQALALMAAFETYGIFVGFKSLPFAHSAHLAGLAIGSAYVYLDGKSRIWKPTKRLAFGSMRRLGIV